MAKKPNISKEAQVLLKLLRIALGTEPRKYFGEVVEPFPEGIDWKEVVRLSYEHKVSAIAVDGLEASKYDPYKGLDEKQTEELKAVLVPWIKDVENTEWSYCYYVEVLKTLCQIFKNNGLTPIILKGYGLSLNYPRPSHRGAGDIDVYLLDKNGNCAFDKGNEIARNILQLSVRNENSQHHSVFTFKGITVENHKTLIGGCWDRTNSQKAENDLRLLLSKGITQESPIFLPSASFNYVFLLFHSLTHCMQSEMTFRQLCDYVSLLNSRFDKIDWNVVHPVIDNNQVTQFEEPFNCMIYNTFMLKQLGVCPSNDMIDIANNLLYSIYLSVNSKRSKMKRLLQYFRFEWHTHFFMGKGSIIATLMRIISYYNSRVLLAKK